MRNTLIAFTAAASFGSIGFAAAPASAAPLAPAHLAAYKGSHVEQVRHWRRDNRRQRQVRRHFRAPGPWAFGQARYQNCFRIGHGVVCYY